jgi:hypothetical protein
MRLAGIKQWRCQRARGDRLTLTSRPLIGLALPDSARVPLEQGNELNSAPGKSAAPSNTPSIASRHDEGRQWRQICLIAPSLVDLLGFEEPY